LFKNQRQSQKRRCLWFLASEYFNSLPKLLCEL
jgi:hypothetical protein